MVESSPATERQKRSQPSTRPLPNVFQQFKEPRITSSRSSCKDTAKPLVTYGSNKKRKFDLLDNLQGDDAENKESLDRDEVLGAAGKEDDMNTEEQNVEPKETLVETPSKKRRTGKTPRGEQAGPNNNASITEEIANNERHAVNGIQDETTNTPSSWVDSTIRAGKNLVKRVAATLDLPVKLTNGTGSTNPAGLEDELGGSRTRSSTRQRKPKVFHDGASLAEEPTKKTPNGTARSKRTSRTPAKVAEIIPSTEPEEPMEIIPDSMPQVVEVVQETPSKKPKGRPRSNKKGVTPKENAKSIAEHDKMDLDANIPNEDTIFLTSAEQPGETPSKSRTKAQAREPTVTQESTTMEVPETPEKSLKITENHESLLADPEAMQITPTQKQIVPSDLALRSKELLEILQDPTILPAFELLKQNILNGLTRKTRLPVIGLDEEYKTVHQLVEQTVVAGEGNSMLLIGARGTAKTTLIETVLSNLRQEHQEDFHVVRLNGFIHTDDKIALKEIWRQLGKEMEVEDEGMGPRNNYADTLASLLALLSHPTELSGTEEPEVTSKSVIFIMDEFDLFASHPRQTLLYNLFDIAQARKAPIAVLGVTTKIDAVESLEKRVKSRFSRRYVHLSLPKTFTAFKDICKAALLDTPPAPNIKTLNDHLAHPDTIPSTLQTAWSSYMSLLLDTSPPVLTLLRSIYAHSKSVPAFLSASLLPIALMSPSSLPNFTSSATRTSTTLHAPDSKLHILPSLSNLALALLISACRLSIILSSDTCNFNLVYDEYCSLTTRHHISSSTSGAKLASSVGAGQGKVFGRDVALREWERLEACELVVPALVGGGGMGSADIGRAGKLWKCDVSLEEVGEWGREGGLGAVMRAWCREL